MNSTWSRQRWAQPKTQHSHFLLYTLEPLSLMTAQRRMQGVGGSSVCNSPTLGTAQVPLHRVLDKQIRVVGEQAGHPGGNLDQYSCTGKSKSPKSVPGREKEAGPATTPEV